MSNSKQSLSGRQQEAYNFIKTHIEDNGWPDQQRFATPNDEELRCLATVVLR